MFINMANTQIQILKHCSDVEPYIIFRYKFKDIFIEFLHCFIGNKCNPVTGLTIY